MVALAFGGGAAPAAQADSQPAILKAYGLDWIERVREEAWPQPKAQRPVICLLDTGVAITPDTPADNPEGPIVARLSVEDPLVGSQASTPNNGAPPGELGLPQGASFSHLHGTRMAAMIAAPRNGEGTVGVFPQGRIVSVRVTEGQEVHIAPANVLRGVRTCLRHAERSSVRAAAIVIAESLYDHREPDLRLWQEAAAVAARAESLFVVAAGNSPEEVPVTPSSVPGVVVVAAGDDGGSHCAFSTSEAARRAVLAPGCSKQVPGLWPGSSSAAALVGGIISAVVTRDPASKASSVATRLGLTQSGALDGTEASAAFSGWLPSALPIAPSVPELVVSRDASQDTQSEEVRLWRPGAHVSWKNKRLRVVRTTRRTSGLLVVRAVGQKKQYAIASRSGLLRLPKRPSRVELWATSRNGSWRSLSARVKVR